jgi:hypothetical protein
VCWCTFIPKYLSIVPFLVPSFTLYLTSIPKLVTQYTQRFILSLPVSFLLSHCLSTLYPSIPCFLSSSLSIPKLLTQHTRTSTHPKFPHSPSLYLAHLNIHSLPPSIPPLFPLYFTFLFLHLSFPHIFSPSPCIPQTAHPAYPNIQISIHTSFHHSLSPLPIAQNP